MRFEAIEKNVKSSAVRRPGDAAIVSFVSSLSRRIIASSVYAEASPFAMQKAASSR